MGERTQFNAGDKVPNDGRYTEVGEDDYKMGINDPKHVTLQAGQAFPETSNQNRKWMRDRH